MKKQYPTAAITNELAGASAFFHPQATPVLTQAPERFGRLLMIPIQLLGMTRSSSSLGAGSPPFNRYHFFLQSRMK